MPFIPPTTLVTQEVAGTLALTATDLDIRDLAFATDKVDASGSTGVGVTGTFFQATQPISAATLPLPTGASTLAGQTQPGVDIGDVTINNAAAGAAVNIQDGGNVITVDGAVTVSGTATVSATDLDIRNLVFATDTVDASGTVLGASANNIGDVDVLTVPAPLSTAGGGLEATALRVTVASDSTGVLSVDDNGSSLTVDGTVAVSSLAGTVAVTQSGTWDEVGINDSGNSITVDGAVTVSAIDLDVRDLAHTQDSIRIGDGVDIADVFDLASANPLAVAIVDGTGTQITSFGGGTQYAEDTVHSSGDTLTLAGVVQQTADAALSADGDRSLLQVDSSGFLKVNVKVGGSTAATAGTSAVTSVTSSTSSVTLLAANTSRLGSMIFNDSTKLLYVLLGTTASATNYTVQLASKAYYEVPFSYVGRIDGIWAAANGAARVTELTA